MTSKSELQLSDELSKQVTAQSCLWIDRQQQQVCNGWQDTNTRDGYYNTMDTRYQVYVRWLPTAHSTYLPTLTLLD
jgi:hypothetical protein